MRKSRSRLFKVCMVSFIVFFVLAVLVGFSACSGCNSEEDGDDDTQGVVATVSSVSVSPTTLSIEEGKTGTIKATVTMTSGSYSGNYTWSSSDTSVATVSADGNTATVTAAESKAGSTATITVAVDNDKTASCVVTVTEAGSGNEPGGEEPGTGEEPGGGDTGSSEATVESVSLNPTSLEIIEGMTGTTTATVTMSDGKTSTSQTLAWSSSNETVATVKSAGSTTSTKMNGTVTAVKAGTATITVTVNEDSSLTASCQVTVTEAAVSGVSLSKTALDLAAGDTETLTATVSMNNGKTASDEVSWSSSNTSAVTVEADETDSHTATVTAVAQGTAKIIATWSDEDGKSHADYCDVTVFGNVNTFEAEDAALLNAVGASGSTNLLGVEESSSFEGVTQVKNFNLEGDRIVYQLYASACINDASLYVWVNPTTDDFDASEHEGFISVNGVAVESESVIPQSAYNAVTATVSLNCGINYIVITLDVSGSSLFGMNMGYMNVDRIDIDYNNSEATVEMVEIGGDVEDIGKDGAASLQAEDGYLLNAAQTQTGSLMTVGKSKHDQRITEVQNFGSSGDKIAFQVAASAAVSDVLLTAYVAPTSNCFDASAGLVSVNGKAVDCAGKVSQDSYGPVYAIISLQAGINYIELETTTAMSVDEIVLGGEIETRVAGSAESSADFKLNGTSFGASSVAATISVDENGNITYTLNGASGTITAAQAKAWEDADVEGKAYIAFEVSVNAGEYATFEAYKDADEQTSLGSWVLDNTTGKVANVKDAEVTEGTFILGVNNGSESEWHMNVTIYDENGNVVDSFTIALGTIEEATIRVEGSADSDASFTLGDSDVEFDGSSVTAEIDEDGNWTLNGASGTITADQAVAWEDSEVEGKAYIAFEVNVNEGEFAVFETYSDSCQTTKTGTWVLNKTSNKDMTIDNLTDYDVTDGTFILGVKYNASSDWNMKVTIYDESGKVKATFKITLGDISDPIVRVEGSADNADVDYELNDVDFDGSSVEATLGENGNWTLNGTSGTITADQAEAWEDADVEGKAYISFTINLNEGEYATIEAFSDACQQSSTGKWILNNTSSKTENLGITGFDSAKETDGSFILGVKNASSVWNMKVTVYSLDGMQKTTFTISLGNISAPTRVEGSADADASYTLGDSDVEFDGSSVTAERGEDGKWVLSGTSGTITEEQAEAWEDESVVGKEYIAFTVNVADGEFAIFETYSDACQNTKTGTWYLNKTSNADMTIQGVTLNDADTTEGSFILGVKEVSSTWNMKVTIYSVDGNVKETFTITLGSISSSSRVVGSADEAEGTYTLNGVEFNGSSVTATYDADTNTWVLEGTSGVINEAQATAWETDDALGRNYIAFTVNVKDGEKATFTAYSSACESEASGTWVLDKTDSGSTGNSNGGDGDEAEETNGTFILGVKDNQESEWHMKVVITNANGDTVASFTISIGAFKAGE